jgi:uncharacterized UPF0160 family protein
MGILNLFKKKITVATHNGSFHADDVFAVATLSIWAEKNNLKLNVIRTRERNVIDEADIVVDVGELYNPEKKRFDHHQREGAGTHDNGVPYASFGLVWKYYAEKITSKDVAREIEQKMVMPIDARDNGIDISTPETNKFRISEYIVKDAIHALRPAIGSSNDYDIAFNKAVQIVQEILRGEIENAEFEIKGDVETAGEIEKQNNPEVLILNEFIKWEKAVSESRNTKIVIYPNLRGGGWCIEVARTDLEKYDSAKILFPKNWRGERDEVLAKASGVRDAIFCHRGGWLAGTQSIEGAIELANKALESA